MKKLLLLSVVCALPLAAMDMDEAPVEISKEVQDLYAQLTKDVHPLLKAYYSGGIPALEKVLATGVDINAIEVHAGKTILDIALDEDKFDLALWCHKRGCISRSRLGFPTLSKAVERGKLGYIKWFVEVEGRSIHGTYDLPLLVVAARCNHLEVVKYLVNKGAYVNAHDNYRGTALMHAAYIGSLDLIKYLVETAKADLDVMDESGRTAKDHAQEQGHSNIALYLYQQEEVVHAPAREKLTAKAGAKPQIKSKL